MNILVDVDGVVLDMHTPWLELYNEKYNDNLTLEDVTAWEIHKLVKPECGEDIFKILYDNMEYVYKNAPVIEGAIEGITKLKKLGFNIVFCTSGIMEHKVRRLAEMGLIENNYRDIIWPKNVVIATNKHLIKGILIDDYDKNIKEGDILFSQPWNMNKNHLGFRCYSWEHVVKSLKILLENKARKLT